MRRLMEVLLKDQDILKNNVQNLHIGFNQYKVPALTQIQNQVRKSVVQQPEGESIIQPKILAKDDSKTSKNNKKQNSQSRSQSNKKLGDKINFKLNRTKTSKQILHQKK
ncbi:unnamed protein product (macronuclear) [Paramecium tetraurelia]|uniref:Uncharacterized protein n=1 Tax=Paramecium tetraurelia TaxID=5888 RepID=A0CXQ8_PARTE|nr:uncharacterized protein GSPATT00011207001 [Paramecium tetraurelia]CAK75575.1 unnamed protein product [Paramecium tetraurelia]|eukprot:XP_001442972.1 hypothetical protein (macronuclear) [Paramecium tetraurelia strain d4-2]